MSEDLVRLRIADDREPGHEAELIMSRARAEQVVDHGLEHYPDHYRWSIAPLEEAPVLAFLNLVEGAVAFAAKYWWAVAGAALAILALLAVYLPQAHYRAGPLVIFGAVSFGLGFAFARHPTGPTLE